MSIYNIRRSIMDIIEGNGLVTIEAGYHGGIDPRMVGSSAPSIGLSTMFFGSIDMARMKRQGSQNVLHIEAASNPQSINSGYVPVSAPADADPAVFSYATAFRQLTAPFGVQVILPPEMSQFSPRNYSAKANAAAEMTRLLEMFNNDYLSHNPGAMAFVPLTNPSGSASSFTYAFAQLTEGNTLASSLGEISIDVDTDAVYMHSPVARRIGKHKDNAFTDATNDPTGAADTSAKAANLPKDAVSMAFDPRVALGMRVSISDSQRGPSAFFIDGYMHHIGSGSNGWQTDIEGPSTGASPFLGTV